MSRNYYKRNAYNVICDSCGFRFKNGELRERWDGVMCCAQCWTPRQPQDLLRARKENLQLPFVRPRPKDVFVQFYTVNLSDTTTVTDAVGVSKFANSNDIVSIVDIVVSFLDNPTTINGDTINSFSIG